MTVAMVTSSTTNGADRLTVAPRWRQEQLAVRAAHTQLVDFGIRLPVKRGETLRQVPKLDYLRIQSDLKADNEKLLCWLR